MTGSYNLLLVFASYCVAVIAAYTAIYFGTKVFELSGANRKFWLGAGALCLGTGIWSMHFVGMSAYEMPMEMDMTFNAGITALSWVPAILASALALYVITLPSVSARSIVASAFIMGTGIFCMHYTGMYAMKMNPPIQYDMLLVAISGVIAVVASGAALVICRKVRDVPEQYVLIVKIVAALVMGVAICGMHYTGMAAANYHVDASMASSNSLRGDWMGVPTAIAASVFLLLAVYIAWHDFRDIEGARKSRQQRVEAAEHAAFFDVHTGLPNKFTLEAKVLEKIRVQEGGTAESFKLLHFELSDYRNVLQNKGEEAAQVMAKHFAQKLKAQLSMAEVITRSSANGFTALIPASADIGTKQLIKPLIREFAFPVSVGAQTVAFNWGVGVSEYPKSGTNSRNLIRHAQQIRSEFTASEKPARRTA